MKRDVSPRQSGAPLAASGCVDVVGFLSFFLFFSFFFLVSDLIRSLHVSPLRPLCGAGGRGGGARQRQQQRQQQPVWRRLTDVSFFFFFLVGMQNGA